MDIQSLIKLAHQADLEGNYRVADKLTERAIREAAPFWRRRGPGSGGGGGGLFGAPPGFGSMNQNNQGGHSGGGAGGPSGPISTGRVNTKGGDGGDAMGGDATNKNKSGRVTISPALAEAKRKQGAGEPLSAEEQKLIDKAAKNAEYSREYRLKQKATGGDGNAGGGGGAGGNNTGATVDTRGGSSSADGGSNNPQTNNARYKTRDIGGDVIGIGAGGSVALAGVPTAIVAA